jgi:hypothetical protein
VLVHTTYAPFVLFLSSSLMSSFTPDRQPPRLRSVIDLCADASAASLFRRRPLYATAVIKRRSDQKTVVSASRIANICSAPPLVPTPYLASLLDVAMRNLVRKALGKLGKRASAKMLMKTISARGKEGGEVQKIQKSLVGGDLGDDEAVQFVAFHWRRGDKCDGVADDGAATALRCGVHRVGRDGGAVHVDSP